MTRVTYYQRKFTKVGGSELFAFNLFSELKKYVEIKIITLNISNEVQEYLDTHFQNLSKNIHVIKLSNILFHINDANFWFTNYGLEEVFFIKLLFRKNINYFAHDTIIYDENNLHKKKKYKFLKKLYTPFLEKYCDNVFVLSKFAKNERISKYGYTPTVMRAAIKKIEIIENKKNLDFLSISRLEPKKNIDKLLHLWKIMMDIYPSSNLNIIGSGSEYGNLLKLSKNLKLSRIYFRGFVSESEKNDYYKQSSLTFCLDCADFDMTMWESLAFGTPVLSNLTFNIDEIYLKNNWVIKSELTSDILLKNTDIILSKKRFNDILYSNLNDFLFSSYARNLKVILKGN